MKGKTLEESLCERAAEMMSGNTKTLEELMAEDAPAIEEQLKLANQVLATDDSRLAEAEHNEKRLVERVKALRGPVLFSLAAFSCAAWLWVTPRSAATHRRSSGTS